MDAIESLIQPAFDSGAVGFELKTAEPSVIKMRFGKYSPKATFFRVGDKLIFSLLKVIYYLHCTYIAFLK